MSDPTQDRPPIRSAANYAADLERAFASLLRILALFEETEIESAHLPGGWTPKTVVAHVGFWDHVQTERMMAALAGPEAQARIPWPTTDNNERAVADQERAWDEVLTQATRARQRLVDFAAGLTPEMLAATYAEGDRTLSIARLLDHMVKHVREHAGELFAYCGSLDRWGRDGWRAFLIRQQRNLLDAIGGMSEAWLVSERVSDNWTGRDLLAHVLCWEEYAWAVTKKWPAPSSQDLAPWFVPGEDEDQTNDRLMAEKIDHTLIDLLDWLTTYHRRTLRSFDSMSDEDLRSEGETGFGRESFTGFLYGMAMHTAEHAAHIWQARPDSSRGSGEGAD